MYCSASLPCKKAILLGLGCAAVTRKPTRCEPIARYMTMYKNSKENSSVEHSL